jgi:GT2 family glycosyltransferase
MSFIATMAIINYYSDDDARRLVADILERAQRDIEIFIVNNSPSSISLDDWSPSLEAPAQVRICHPRANLGYLPGVQWLISQHEELLYRPLIVSNSDIRIPDPGCLDRLLDVDGICVAPQVQDLDGAQRNPYLGHRPGTLRMLLNALTLSAYPLYRLRRLVNARRRRSMVRTASARKATGYAPFGAFFLLQPDFFRAGARLPTTFLFGEEEVLGEEIHRCGGQTHFLLDCTVHHVGGVSTGAEATRDRWRLQRRGALHILLHRLRRFDKTSSGIRPR